MSVIAFPKSFLTYLFGATDHKIAGHKVAVRLFSVSDLIAASKRGEFLAFFEPRAATLCPTVMRNCENQRRKFILGEILRGVVATMAIFQIRDGGFM